MRRSALLRRGLIVLVVTTAHPAAAWAQDRPSGLVLAPADAEPSYVLFGSIFGTATHLVEAASGQVVHSWQSDYGPTGSIYLLDNGNLLRGARDYQAPVFRGGGLGGRLQEFTWEGELVWDFPYATEDHVTHHDIEVLPNGNILAIAWESKTREEARAMGYRPELIPEGGIWPDKVIEIEPRRPDGARIVWEWHAWDHMIQDLDPALRNYGDPSRHPELIDINANREPPESVSEEDRARYRELGYVPDEDEYDPSPDRMHTNAIAYNAELDQIALSVPNFDEIWIIDHSTTIGEAAGHTGGRWGRGGDLLYRWGNPANYGRGGPDDRRLGFEHDIKWVPDGMPGAGHLILYNNRVPPDGTHSAALEIVPPTDAAGRYVIADGEAFGPPEPLWSYQAPDDPTSLFSPIISGVQRLPSGNTLITEGVKGRFLEVTPSGDVVWDYWSPTSGEVMGPNGQPTAVHLDNPYAVFRATKIPATHPALRGRTLTPLVPQPTPIPPPERDENAPGGIP